MYEGDFDEEDENGLKVCQFILKTLAKSHNLKDPDYKIIPGYDCFWVIYLNQKQCNRKQAEKIAETVRLKLEKSCEEDNVIKKFIGVSNNEKL